MKINRWCDCNDCPNHPDYMEIEEVNEEKISDEEFLKNMVPISVDMSQSHSHTMYSVASNGSNGYSNSYAAVPSYTNMQVAGISPGSIECDKDIELATAAYGIKLETESISIPLECFACSFMKKQNVKKALVINKAKRLLQGEE